MRRFASSFSACLLVLLAALVGGVSQLCFILFLFFGALDVVYLGMNQATGLFFNACLSLAFFTQHSTMIRRPYRRWLSRFVRADCHGALYTIASGAALLTVVVFWQTSATVVAVPQGPTRWLMRAVFFLAGALFLWTLHVLHPFDPFGLRSALANLRGTESPRVPLVVGGPYRWVRHPLYLVTLLIIWSCPNITLDRLLFNVLWTAWVIIATALEERDLTAEFGEPYQRYQQRVPMLIPWRIPLQHSREP